MFNTDELYKNYVERYFPHGPLDPKTDILLADLSTWKDNYFGLFKPYKDRTDFLHSAALPLLAPAGLFAASFVCSMIATAASVVTLFCLAAAGVAAVIDKNTEMRDDALIFGFMGAYGAGLATLASLTSSLLFFVSLPAVLLSIGTRSYSTLQESGWAFSDTSSIKP